MSVSKEFARETVALLYPDGKILDVQPFSFIFNQDSFANHDTLFNGNAVYVGYVVPSNQVMKDDGTLVASNYPLLYERGQQFVPALGVRQLLVFDELDGNNMGDVFSMSFVGFRVSFSSSYSSFNRARFSNVYSDWDFCFFVLGAKKGVFCRNDNINTGKIFTGSILDGSIDIGYLTGDGSVQHLNEISFGATGFKYQYYIGYLNTVFPLPSYNVVNNLVSDAVGFSFDVLNAKDYSITCTNGASSKFYSGGDGVTTVAKTTLSLSWDVFFGGSSRPAGWDFNHPFTDVAIVGNYDLGGDLGVYFNNIHFIF